MVKQVYKGSLTLEWYNKKKAIALLSKDDLKSTGDTPAPRIRWVNQDEALFYEYNEEEGRGIEPFWVNRGDIRVKESRPLHLEAVYRAVEDETDLEGHPCSYKVVQEVDDDPEVENILIKGDNLLALNALKKHFAKNGEKVHCVYIDPPYNTGKAFEKYDDNLEHSEWLTMLRDRLEVIKSLMVEGGYVFVQLDDSEGAYGKLVLDELFGRNNYVVTIYVQVRYDVKTLKEDMDFNKVIEQVHVYRNMSSIKIPLNKECVEYTNTKFCVKISELDEPSAVLMLGGKKVCVFSEGRYKVEKVKPSKDGLKEIWASGSILDGNSSGRFFRDYLTGRDKEDGLKILYKVEGIGGDGLGYRYFTGPRRQGATRGKYYQGMPLDKKKASESYKYLPISNYIDLAAFFGNCRHEGGVEFKSGKKPEILVQKLLEIATSPGDVVLDCFGGSGTTFAVAHKMGRRWVGVEVGEHADTHIIPRLCKVIGGEDRTGISEEWGWKGGGAFKYYTLGSSIIKVDGNGQGDFVWELGVEHLQDALLSSYDYILGDDSVFPSTDLFGSNPLPSIGVLRAGGRSMAAACSLCEPQSRNELMPLEEIERIYSALGNSFTPEYVTIFTNRGVEMALDSKPDDLEIVKVPHAIFAELEK